MGPVRLGGTYSRESILSIYTAVCPVVTSRLQQKIWLKLIRTKGAKLDPSYKGFLDVEQLLQALLHPVAQIVGVPLNFLPARQQNPECHYNGT